MTPQVAGGKWRAKLVPVTVGMLNDQFASITSGIGEGDQVIYAGYSDLHDGDPVVATEWGPDGPRSLPPAAGEAPAGTKYTCLMHPEVISDHPGVCPKCGMRLVPKAPAEGGRQR